MGKSILITSTDLMMIQFLVPHIIYLSQNGYEVEVACSAVGGRMEEIREELCDYTKAIYVVRLHRSPLNLGNVNGYKDMKCIIEENHYDIVWTNEPVMGVVTRLAAKKARKKGTKVLYMTHGFHFYKGAPIQNWLLFYPIERLMASKCDVICTINREDYKRAQRFNVKRVEYVHGIGINTDRLTPKNKQGDIRSELGLSEKDFLVLSVGELNANKNQQVIIKAIEQLRDKNIHYLLCGKGDQRQNLEKLATELGVEDRVHFLGYRKDVVDICSQADVYVMPSLREGLPIASLEAMYCGLPLVTSNIRGLVDVMEHGVTGYMCFPNDVQGFSDGIRELKEHPDLRKQMGAINQKVVRPYCLSTAKVEVLRLINNL